MATVNPPGISEFTTLRQIGEGGYGSVYLLRHPVWGEVVLKQLRKSNDIREQDMTALQREAEILKSLRHPNIVTLYEAAPVGSNVFGLFLEHLEHGSVDHFLEEFLVDTVWKTQIIFDVALAMRYLHGQRPAIIHGDLKCQNILIGSNFHAKICDFGLARIRSISNPLTEHNISGTLQYIAPEYLKEPRRKKSETFDVYSYAISVWEIFSQKRAYYDFCDNNLISEHVIKGERPLMEDVDGNTSETVRQIIRTSWKESENERPTFNSIRDMLFPLISDDIRSSPNICVKPKYLPGIDLSKSDFGKLQKKLEEFNMGGFEIINVPMDANCMFTSLARQLGRMEDTASDDIRAEVLQFLKDNPNMLHIDADSIRQYLEVLAKPATWGEGIVLSAAAMLYKRRICVYSENGVRPVNIDGSALDINQNPELHSTDDDTCIRLGCVGNVHYVSIERDNSVVRRLGANTNSSIVGVVGNPESGSIDFDPEEKRTKCIDTTGRVKGIAVLGERIFISKVWVKIIEGFSTKTHNRVIEVPVNALEELRDMVACQRRKVLYLSDRIKCAIIQVSVDCMETLSWSTGTIPEGLSVTDDSAVLVSCPSEQAIKEFAHDGTQVRMISLPIEHSLRLYHGWKMKNGTFLVCYGPDKDKDKVPVEQNRVFLFAPAEQSNILMYPSGNTDKMLCFLRVAETKRGFIIVISYHEKKVLLLDSKLQLIRVLIETKDDFKPNRMCLDETNKRLYVSEHSEDSTRSRISIYDLDEDILNGV